MSSWYTGLPEVQPWWWKRFVRFMNRTVLETSQFLGNLTTAGILFLVLGFWLLVMGIWIRQFSVKIVRFYWGFVGIYFLFGIWLLF